MCFGVRSICVARVQLCSSFDVPMAVHTTVPTRSIHRSSFSSRPVRGQPQYGKSYAVLSVSKLQKRCFETVILPAPTDDAYAQPEWRAEEEEKASDSFALTGALTTGGTQCDEASLVTVSPSVCGWAEARRVCRVPGRAAPRPRAARPCAAVRAYAATDCALRVVARLSDSRRLPRRPHLRVMRRR